MLRIAFVLANPMYPDVVGGAEIFTYTMAYTFAKKGIEAHVVAFGGSKFKSFRSGNLHWHAVRINLKRLRTIIFTIKIIKILFKIKPDVCLAIMGQSSIPCLVYSRLTGKPTFIRLAGGEFAAAFKDIRIYNLSRRIYNKLIIKILKNYYIIALNKEVFEVLRKISKHTYLIPNPIDNIFFQANPDITGYTVIYVGAFRNDKNLLLLIEAFNEVTKEVPEANLILVGDGPLRPVVEQKIKEYNLVDKVIITGFLPYVKIPGFLRKATVFVLPSYVEGLSNALLQAMAAGLPCVASDIPGNRDIIVDGYNGFLCAPDDKKAFAIAIAKILKDKGMAQQMSCNARNSVRMLTMDNVMKMYLSIFLDALRGEA